MNKTALSYLLIALGAACWGLIGIPNRILLACGLTPSMLVVIRPGIAAIILGAILAVSDRGAFRIRLRDLWCFLGTGIVSLTLFNYCYTTAQTYMSLSAAVVLLYTSPIFVVLFSAPLFKERITPPKIIALICVVAGAVLSSGLLSGGASLSLAGVAFGVASGFGYALYSIFSRFALQRGYSSNTITWYTFAFSTLGSLALNNPADFAHLTLAPSIVGWSLALGVVCCLIPYALYTKGLENVENGPASVVASLEMVVGTLVGFLVFHEALDAASIGGVLLVLAGIFVMNGTSLLRRKK